MKRRFAALLLIICTLLTLMPMGNAAGIYFIAVNDTVPLTLSTDVAPYFLESILLVPHTAFSVSGLGVTPSYDAEEQTLTLFSRNKRLSFDLIRNKVTDEKGNTKDTICANRGGAAFLPVALCADHFGYAVSVQTSLGGYQVIRFTNGTQVYNDALFIQKADNLISYRVQQYLSEQAAASTPAKPEPAPQKPEKPISPLQPVQPVTPPQPEVPKKAPTNVYLAAADAATMADSLRVLKNHDLPAVFFLTAEEIRENPALVLSIRAAGYPIGLTIPEGETQVLQSLQAANSELDAVIQSKTLLVLLPGEQTADAQGYFVVNRSQAVTASGAAQREGGNSLIVCSHNCSAAVATLTAADANFRQLRETSPF